MTSVVVSRFSEAGRNFEIYSDGACVVENATAGFMEFSAETIQRMAQAAPMKKQDHHSPATEVKAAPSARSDDTPTERKISKSITRLESGSWECVFTEKGNILAEHTYSSRDFARKGSLDTVIGKNGRLS